MKSQPNRNYVSNDDIQTPLKLARHLVAHFQPTGKILEPCRGDGNFLKALRENQRSSAKISGSKKTQVSSLSSQVTETIGATEREARRWTARGLGRALAPSMARGGSRRVPLGDGNHKLGSSAIKPASQVLWCEIKRGRDFFEWDQPVDWIITNPPWSQIRDFLCHAMELSDHVVFLFTINHLWTKARLRDIRNADYGIREIVLVDMPKTFPQSGFQLGAVHLQYGWKGKIALSELSRK